MAASASINFRFCFFMLSGNDRRESGASSKKRE
jgi:hypothetical protein